MANLLVEIGNTALKAAWSDEMTLGKTFRYQGEKCMDYILSVTQKEKPDVMVVSAAYPISPSDEALLRAECASLIILDSDHRETLEPRRIPQYVSSDRAASIIAARYLFKNHGCTIIDFGTTLTIDFIGADGVYEGGNISLGCRTRFKALNRYSRSLPLINTPDDPPVKGNSLDASIKAGVVSGIMFEIEGYTSRYSENMVVFTGGDANYFAKRMKSPIFVVSNLVLMGLAIIADEYVKNMEK
ncbi:MAG: type III pantothenate kinase [Bacteroidales bacterium]|nr:type III pantothenate kinase [Bacteroidales bacterium]